MASKLNIQIEFKGREELQQILAQIGKKHSIPIDADLSQAKMSIEQDLHDPLKKMFSGFKGAMAGFGLVMNGIRQAYDLFRKSVGVAINAAQEQESAEIALKGALRATGMEIEQNAIELSSFASEMQKVTIYGDEMLMTSMAQMQNIARFDNTDTLKKATKAAIGLSAAFGIDLSTAMDLIGKAGAGNTSMLGRYGIVLDETVSQSEKFNQVLQIGTSYFGIAEDQAKSSLGSWTQLKNAFGDLQEILASGLIPVFDKTIRVFKPLLESFAQTHSLEAQKRALVGQRIEFERLVLVYKDLHFQQNRSKEQNERYAKTINDLMAKYPNYLGNIDLEKGKWNEISTALLNARTQLQSYINLKIQEAILKDMEDQIVDVSTKIVDAESALYTLRAEFEAGIKSPMTTVRTVADPLAGGGRGAGGTAEVMSKWGMEELKLEGKMKSLTKKQEELNEVMRQRLEIAQSIYAVPPVEQEQPGGGGTGNREGSAKQSEVDKLLSEIEDYRILRKANFDEEQGEIALLRRDYAEKLKIVAGNTAAEGDLKEKRDMEISKIQAKYQEQREKDEATHYEKLKFFAEGYYDWKLKQIESEAEKAGASEAWKREQIEQLNKDRSEWDNRVIKAFEEKYSAEMSHLAELRDLGLATYSEVAEKAWEYYDTLMAIVEADGVVTEEEKKLLEMYRKRGQAAQLAVNRDSDLAAYYDEVRFLDSSYYDWKKARIEEDVRLMDISEEQKAALIKAKLDALKLEMQDFYPDKSLFNHFLDSLDIPTEHQAKIISSFQSMANQISSIWSQLYSNLASNRDQSLADLERRAKKERKTDAWLAKEKDRINEDYEKKHRALKRTEQRMQIASATSNTLEGITNALTVKPAWLAPIMAASVGTLGFAQVKLIAEQKFATGGHFRGRGSSTSDSNIIAVSDNEYIVSADRVNRFGVPFFDALNFGNGEQIRKALSSIRIPTPSISYPAKTHGYASGGVVRPQTPVSQNVAMNVVLKCDGKALAKAVMKGTKKIIST